VRLWARHGKASRVSSQMCPTCGYLGRRYFSIKSMELRKLDHTSREGIMLGYAGGCK
jgi:hypothetical protein